MKSKLLLLFLLIGKTFTCFAQAPTMGAINRSLLTVTVRVDELEKKGYKVIQTNLSTQSSIFKIDGGVFAWGDTIFLEAMVITDKMYPFPNNSYLSVYSQLKEWVSKPTTDAKQSFKDSLLNKGSLIKTYTGRNKETIGVWETIFKAPEIRSGFNITFSANLTNAKNHIEVVAEPGYEYIIPDVTVFILYVLKK